MATTTDIRAWLIEQGHEVPAKGRLPGTLTSLYEQAHRDEYPVTASALDGGVSEADFGPEPGEDAEDLEPSVPMQPERRPRTQSQRRTAARQAQRKGRIDRGIDKIFAWGSGEQDPKAKARAKAAKAKTRPPRVSLEKFTGRFYDGCSRILEPLSPAAATCMRVQAPMAAVVIDGVVKDTVLDRIVQPAARLEDKLDVVFGLVAAPAACIAVEYTFQVPQTPRIVMQRAMSIQLLREALRATLEVSEDYAEQITAMMAKREVQDAEVDRLIRMIFPQMRAPEPEPVPEPEMAMA